MPIEEIENEDGRVTRVHHTEPTSECEPDVLPKLASWERAKRTMRSRRWNVMDLEERIDFLMSGAE